jgi:hypothetical protein
MKEFFDEMRAWMIANPLTREDVRTGRNNVPGFWQDKKQQRTRIYTIQCPNGTIIKTNCLADFCKEHDLKQSNMCNVANGKANHHKGYKVIK